MLEQNKLHIYTDGACKPNPGKGGYAVRFVYLMGEREETKDFEYSGTRNTTNNEMELTGVIKGLDEALDYEELGRFDSIELFTDSMYVTNNYLNSIFKWPKEKWMGSAGAIDHVPLWKRLQKNLKKLNSKKKRVNIKHVKGHSKNIHNRAVDILAVKSRENCLYDPISPLTVRKKKFKEGPKIKSIRPRGQTFTIKIFTCKYFRTQKLWKYGYQVVSEDSVHYKESGSTYYKDLLRTRDLHRVTLSDSERENHIAVLHSSEEERNIEPIQTE